MNVWRRIQEKLTYVRIITIGYLLVTIAGTLLLMLPAATTSGEGTDFFTAFLRRLLLLV